MWSTSNADNNSSVLTVRSSDTDATRRSTSVSTRNAGVPVSNQWPLNSRLSNSSSTSYGLYTFSAPRQR